MFLQFGVPVVPPEVDLDTRMVVIASIDPAFRATVSGAPQLLDAFLFGDGLKPKRMLRGRAFLRTLTQDEQRQKKQRAQRWRGCWGEKYVRGGIEKP